MCSPKARTKRRKLFAHWNLKSRRYTLVCMIVCCTAMSTKILRACRICKHPQYKRRMAKDKYKLDSKIKTGILFKVVWYLPLIPRLKRLFANPREAKRLWWHHDDRTADKYMRHPKDGAQWEQIADRFKDFAKDPRNIWLGAVSYTHLTLPTILLV